MQPARCNRVDDFTPEEQLLFAILAGPPLTDQSAAEIAAEFLPFPLLHRVHCYLTLLEDQ